MFDALKRYTSALGGFADVPRRRAEQIASALAKQGLISTEQVRSLTSELARRGQENRERVLEIIKRELPRLGVASQPEVDRLRQRVQALEATNRATAKRAAPLSRSKLQMAAKAPKKRPPAKKAKARAKKKA